MPQPKIDEEKDKEQKELKILIQNKLKNEKRQILYLLYQCNKLTKTVYNNPIKSL